jgi:hypothetical protein
MSFPDLCRFIFTSRYTKSLEDEVNRLRAENRSLLDSLLGTAGAPPVSAERRDASRSGEAVRKAPLRPRRSWQQVSRLLELGEAFSSRRGGGIRTPEGRLVREKGAGALLAPTAPATEASPPSRH